MEFLEAVTLPNAADPSFTSSKLTRGGGGRVLVRVTGGTNSKVDFVLNDFIDVTQQTEIFRWWYFPLMIGLLSGFYLASGFGEGPSVEFFPMRL